MERVHCGGCERESTGAYHRRASRCSLATQSRYPLDRDSNRWMDLFVALAHTHYGILGPVGFAALEPPSRSSAQRDQLAIHYGGASYKDAATLGIFVASFVFCWSYVLLSLNDP